MEDFTAYLREVRRFKALERLAQKSLFRKLNRARVQGDRACVDSLVRAMIERNQRLVINIARRYWRRGSYLKFLDLVQEANFGLIRAIEKFDRRMGFAFSTYAHWWIRQTLRRAISESGNTVRLPEHVRDKIPAFERACERLHAAGIRDPTDAELAKELGWKTTKVHIVRVGMRAYTLSLDMLLGDDDGANLGETIKDQSSIDPEVVAIAAGMRAFVERLLATLNGNRPNERKERAVLELRFGLKDNDPHTLEEIGEIFGVSRERIRQIEKSALQKLRIRESKLRRPHDDAPECLL